MTLANVVSTVSSFFAYRCDETIANTYISDLFCSEQKSTVCKYQEINKNNLKEFFHGSAHARVLRNLICVPARNKANF